MVSTNLEVLQSLSSSLDGLGHLDSENNDGNNEDDAEN